jgi:hypothetical protein
MSNLIILLLLIILVIIITTVLIIYLLVMKHYKRLLNDMYQDFSSSLIIPQGLIYFTIIYLLFIQSHLSINASVERYYISVQIVKSLFIT